MQAPLSRTPSQLTAVPLERATMPPRLDLRRGIAGTTREQRRADDARPSEEEATLVLHRASMENRSIRASHHATADRGRPAGSTRLAGRYELRALIGSGTTAEVYEAYDSLMHRCVALKVVSRRRNLGGAKASRLLSEARALAMVSHPNVITLYDLELRSDEGFLSMELVQGRTLRAWLREAQRPLAAVLRVFLDAGEGLAATHAAGLVHRNFNQTAVLVGDDGRIRLIGFGLASEPTFDPSTRKACHEKTASARVGGIAGTPGFLAPEQVFGHAVGPAADQFALCAALYEALYGQRPFSVEAPVHVVTATLKGILKPATPEDQVPARLRCALLRGLCSSPERRFPSMVELLHELRACFVSAARAARHPLHAEPCQE